MTFNAEDVPPMATITGKVGCSKPIFVDHFKFLKSVAKATPKLTIPAPAALHFRGGRNAISREVYPDLGTFWADAAAAYRKAIAQIAAAGCSYLQLDDVSFAYLCDPKVRENLNANSERAPQLPTIAAAWVAANSTRCSRRSAGQGMRTSTEMCLKVWPRRAHRYSTAPGTSRSPCRYSDLPAR